MNQLKTFEKRVLFENSHTAIYMADASQLNDDALFDEQYHKVSAMRRAKIDRLKFRKDKNLSLAAESLFICACSDFGIDYADSEIVTDDFGKPQFAGTPQPVANPQPRSVLHKIGAPLFFNLSHSGERAMCVMSDNPVGCDVEKCRNVNLRLAERFFSEEESSAVESCATVDDKEDLLVRLWTLKESCIKCVGKGLKIPLSSFTICLDDADQVIIKDANGYPSNKYEFPEFDLHDGYKYACCIENRE